MPTTAKFEDLDLREEPARGTSGETSYGDTTNGPSFRCNTLFYTCSQACSDYCCTNDTCYC